MCFYNRLHLIKICLCCFLDKHLYSNNLSTIATISSLIKSELFPACFSCSNKFNLSQIHQDRMIKRLFLKHLKQKQLNLVILIIL